jgi:hypothetical protein
MRVEDKADNKTGAEIRVGGEEVCEKIDYQKGDLYNEFEQKKVVDPTNISVPNMHPTVSIPRECPETVQ